MDELLVPRFPRKPTLCTPPIIILSLVTSANCLGQIPSAIWTIRCRRLIAKGLDPFQKTRTAKELTTSTMDHDSFESLDLVVADGT